MKLHLNKRNEFNYDENGLQQDPEISKLKYKYYKRQLVQTYNIILEVKYREIERERMNMSRNEV